MTGAGSGGQGPPDEMDAEEAERCPICLSVLAGGELAMPDSCCHVFCLRCLLTWAEMAPSCPVDRRPFTNVYRWDGDLSCVQVPVKKKETQPEAESCCCRNPEEKLCLKSKPARRTRRQKVERMADTKTKGLVRKCNDEDPSALSRKKVRGTECCTSPSPSVSLTASTQDVVWVTENIPYDTGFQQCKPQVPHCPWLSPAASIPADGTLRQRYDPSSWHSSQFSFGYCSSPFTSSTLLGSGHFVFQGVVCAITCPKGGEKRGGRGSTSKAPTKGAESRPSRRSGRNSKSQEETTVSEPSSPPQSSSSDCDSSTNQSTKAGKTSQVPVKRKGKKVTNRKASGKRKAPARKKSSPEVVSSPAVSEEEEEGERSDGRQVTEVEEEENKMEQEPEAQNSEQQQSESEGSLNADLDHFNSADEQDGESVSNAVGQDSDGTQEQSNECEQEDKPDEGDGDLSFPSNSAPNSPSSCSEGEQSKIEEEEPASPVSSGDKDSDKINSPSPSHSHNALMEDLMSPHCDDQTEQDDNMVIYAEAEEAHSEESSKDVKVESSENLSHPGSADAEESEQNAVDPETHAYEGSDVKMLKAGEPVVEGTQGDDTKVVPMDCSSPLSEHSDDPILSKESCEGAVLEPPASDSKVAMAESSKDQPEREKSQERKNGRQRRSRFHSPTSTWSPKRDSKRDSSRRSRSRSKERDSSPPSSRSSRARSKEKARDRDGEREYSRRDRSRERRRRRSRSRSRSRSHSRSRSRSRTRSYRRGPSPERAPSREQSPQRKERRAGWRSGQGSGSGGEGRRHHGGAGRFENGVPTENSPDRQGWSENPDWVTEKTREAEGRNRDFGFSGGSRWGEARGRGGRGGFERGRGGGRGGSNRSFYSQQEESTDNRWQTRNNFSGTGNNSGNDSYSRFNENRGGGRRKESEAGDTMLDRSGWSSASSWAVRRTLPADVQDYYSKRERGGPGGWSRQEEEQQPAAADPPQSEPVLQTVPGNAPVPVMAVIPPHPPQLNVLHHHYPMQGPRGALPVTLQPAAPYAMPPQVPVHLHPAVPLLQMPAVGAQGLPPPPPPPPPMQQGSQTVAAQPDSHTTQMVSTIGGFSKPALLPTPTKAGFAAATQVQPAPSQVLPSSTTQPGYNKAQADSSKKEKKQQIQERAINEVKTAIKPFYQKKEITKEEYKEIVRKAVEKVCHSKSGEVNSSKVANLVKAYVDKYKHARKK